MSEPAKNWRLSPEMITAMTAVVIGVGAIGVALYETTLVRQQLKGSAWPNIEGGFSYNEDGFRYFLTNSGVGPARIQYAEITVDGEPVGDWREFFAYDDCWVKTMADDPVTVRACAGDPDRQVRN